MEYINTIALLILITVLLSKPYWGKMTIEIDRTFWGRKPYGISVTKWEYKKGTIPNYGKVIFRFSWRKKGRY